MVVQLADLHLVEEETAGVQKRQHPYGVQHRLKGGPGLDTRRTCALGNLHPLVRQDRPRLHLTGKTIPAGDGHAVPILVVQQIKVPAPVPLGQDLDVVSSGLDRLDDLPGGGGVVPPGVWVAGKAQVDGLARDGLPVKLPLDLLHDVRPGLHAGVELLRLPAQNARSETVKAPVRAAGVDIDGVVSVLLGLSFWYVNRLHLWPPCRSPPHCCAIARATPGGVLARLIASWPRLAAP